MRLGVDRRAIGPAGHEAIPQFAVRIEFARQDPADHEQKYDDAQRNQRAALAPIFPVIVRHARLPIQDFRYKTFDHQTTVSR
jgi:hypothetical protein